MMRDQQMQYACVTAPAIQQTVASFARRSLQTGDRFLTSPYESFVRDGETTAQRPDSTRFVGGLGT